MTDTPADTYDAARDCHDSYFHGVAAQRLRRMVREKLAEKARRIGWIVDTDSLAQDIAVAIIQECPEVLDALSAGNTRPAGRVG
jgi:hypothetical protein